MRRKAAWFLFLALSVLMVSASEAGQELSFSAGKAVYNDKNDTALAWQGEYRNDFHRNIAASVSYLNEGHVTGRKRDGLALQGWGVTHLLEEKLLLGLGLGPYRYHSTNCAKIERGWAAMASVSATYYVEPSWFIRANWSRIEDPNDGDSDLFLAGGGLRF